jgi:hypothetical protein
MYVIPELSESELSESELSLDFLLNSLSRIPIVIPMNMNTTDAGKRESFGNLGNMYRKLRPPIPNRRKTTVPAIPNALITYKENMP